MRNALEILSWILPVVLGFRGGGGIKYDFPNLGSALDVDATGDIRIEGEDSLILRSPNAVIGVQIDGGAASTGKVSLNTSTGGIQIQATNSDVELRAAASGVVKITGNETIAFNAAEDAVIQRLGAGVLYTPGRWAIDDGILMSEEADPAAPAANKAILYVKDVAGKTALFARFPTGAVQQVAIEP